MKKYLLSMATIMLVSFMAMGQDNESQSQNQRKAFDPSQMAVKKTEQMTKQLKLDATQKEAVLNLNKEYASKMGPRHGGPQMGNGQRPQRPDSTMTRKRPDKATMEKMRTEKEQVKNEYNTKLKAILTDKQYQKYQKTESERQERHQGEQRDHSEN